MRCDFGEDAYFMGTYGDCFGHQGLMLFDRSRNPDLTAFCIIGVWERDVSCI